MSGCFRPSLLGFLITVTLLGSDRAGAEPAGAVKMASTPVPAVAFQKPFASTSVWNVVLPRSTLFQQVPGIAEIGTGLSSWLIPDGISIPVYRATDSSGTRRLFYHGDTWLHLANGSWRTTGNTASVEAEIKAGSRVEFPYPHHPYVSQSATRLVLPESYNPIRKVTQTEFTFLAPDHIKPTSNPDAHMAVFLPDGLVVESYGTIILSDGTVVALTYQVTSSLLAGDGWQNGVTASMIPLYAGLLRMGDLDSGTIAHALKVVAPPALLHPSFVYPALSFDRGALTEAVPYSGTLPMGARLALPPSFDLLSLKLETTVGRMIARAAQTYGFIVTDRGGEGMTIIAEAGLAARLEWSAASQRDLDKIIRSTQRAIMPSSAYQMSVDR